MKYIFTIFLCFASITCQAQCLSNSGVMGPSISLPDNLGEADSDSIDEFIRSSVDSLANILGVKYGKIEYVEVDNAFANRDGNTLTFGQAMIRRCLSQTNGKLRLQFVIAHELSHLYQYQHNNPPNPFFSETTDKHIELQADYMGGYAFFNLKKVINFKYSDPLLILAQETRVGDYSFYDTDHHGVTAERQRAVLYGALNNKLSPADAFSSSPTYVAPASSLPKTKTLDEANIIGDITINGNKLFYISYSNEVYVKENGKYIQVGAIREVPEELATFFLQVMYKSSYISYKVSWGKVYDNNKLIGQFNFYSQHFSR